MSGSLTDVGCGCDNYNTPDTNNYKYLTKTDGPKEVMIVAGFSAYQIAVANGYVGTEAEWLASLGTTDKPTFETITGLGNGITFNPVGSSVTRTLQSKLSDVLSVLDFGADSTGQLDASASFSSAAEAASASGIIYVNPGEYNVASKVAGSSSITWIVRGNIIGTSISDLPGNYIFLSSDGSITLSHSDVRLPGIENYEGENPDYESGINRLYTSGGVLKIWQ